MKLIVQVEVSPGVFGCGGVGHRHVEGEYSIERLGIPQPRDLAGGQLLEPAQQLELIGKVRRVERCYDSSDMRAQYDQPLGLQNLQRFAQRCARNPEFAAQIGLRQALSRLPAVGDDVLADIGEDLLVNQFLYDYLPA